MASAGREAIQREYARLAPRYDRRWSGYVEASVRETLGRATLRPPGQRILDLGCGTGALTARLVQAGAIVVGVDLSPDMLQIARQKLPGKPALVVADAHQLPLRDGSFDLVVSNSAFHYWRRPELALLEARRVLVPGGVLVLTDWCHDYLACRLCDWPLRLLSPAHHRTYGVAACQGLLERAGYERIELERYRIGWLWGLMTARAISAPRSTAG